MGSSTMSIAVSKLGGAVQVDPLALDVIRKTIIDQFTSQLPIKSVPGIHNIYRRRGTTPTILVHDVGSIITEGYATATKVTDEVGVLLAQISLDRKVELGHNLKDAWEDQLDAYIPELRDKLSNQIINGTGATDGNFSGLKKLADTFGSAQKFTNSTTTSGVAIQFHHLDRIANLTRGSRKCFVMNKNIALDLKVLGLALGGNMWSQTMVPYAAINEGGFWEIENRPVQAYNGIPIFVDDSCTTETTNGKSGKYRVYCVSLDESTGVSLFYPAKVPSMGMEIAPIQRKESYTESFLRLSWHIGLSAKSSQALAQGTNFKFTNA